MKIVITESQFKVLENLINKNLLNEQLITKLLNIGKNYFDDLAKVDPEILKLGKSLEKEFGGEFDSLLTSLSRKLKNSRVGDNFTFKGVTIPERKMNTILTTIMSDKADRVLQAKLMDNLKKIELSDGTSLGDTLESASKIKNVSKKPIVSNVTRKSVDAEKFLSDIKILGVKRINEEDITDLINYYKSGKITDEDLVEVLDLYSPNFGETYSAMKEYKLYRSGLNKKEGYLSFDEWVIKNKKYNILGSKLKKLGAKSTLWFSEPVELIASGESKLVAKGIGQAFWKTVALLGTAAGVPIAALELIYKLFNVGTSGAEIASAGIDVAQNWLSGTDTMKKSTFKSILSDSDSEMVLPDGSLINIYSSTSKPKNTFNLNQDLLELDSKSIGFSSDAIILKDGLKIYDNKGIGYDTFQISKDKKIIAISGSESSESTETSQVISPEKIKKEEENFKTFMDSKYTLSDSTEFVFDPKTKIYSAKDPSRGVYEYTKNSDGTYTFKP